MLFNYKNKDKKMKKAIQLFICLLLSNVLIAQHAVDQKLSQLVKLNNAPGMNFSIIYEDGQQENFSVGYADIQKNEKMTPQHVMFSGSIGKTYVIAIIAQLADQGLIDIQKKWISYFPDEDWLQDIPNVNDFTILQLMQHRSGLPRYAFKKGVWETAKNHPDKYWTYQDRLSFILGDTAVHAAGDGFAYSDTGYLLLGMLIEKISGKYYPDLINENLLIPLKLKETFAADKRSYPNASNTYSRDEVFQMPGAVFEEGLCKFNPQLENAGGGYVSSASDLAKWAKLYYDGIPFSDSMKTTIQTISPNGANVFEGWHCGAGIFILDTKYGKAYGHTGLMVGTRSIMLYFPELNISAALQMNTDQPEGDLGLLGNLEALVEVALAKKNK